MVLSNEPRKCTVNLLDGQTLDVPLQPKLLTSELLDIVSSHFSLKEKEYFGFCYHDVKDNLCWMRNDKKALDHEFPKSNPIVINFSVRHFITCITSLKDNSTIELFFLQIRKLVFEGDLECDSDTVFTLAAYVLQATHGDFVSENIAASDLKELKVTPVRTLQQHPNLEYCEEQIIEKYKELDGITRGAAIVNYLGVAERLPMYGSHFCDVKDKEQIPWKLGISHRGIALYDFQDKHTPRKVFHWSHMKNLYYSDKKFSLEYREGARPQQLALKTRSNHSLNRINTFRRALNSNIAVQAWYSATPTRCREIWLMAVSQHQFYIDKKNEHGGQKKSLHEVARSLCKSSASITSLYSSSNGGYVSDNTSYYFSLDNESVSSAQMALAEKEMLAGLKARKEFLEELLIEKKEILNELCLKQAEITGELPADLPESPTHPGMPMRRRMGTTFEFDEALLDNESGSKEEHEYDLMLRDYEILKQITQAAHRLALDTSVRKKVRKARQASYEKSNIKLKTMEQQLEYLKRNMIQENNSRLLKQDEIASNNGDSLGPIDGESGSTKSEENPVVTIARKTRYSMFLATPVMTMDKLNNRPSPPSSLISPRYDESTLSRNGTLPRGFRASSRHLKANPRASLEMAMKMHGSADQLNDISSSCNSDDVYICGEFDNTGMYSIGHYKEGDYGSTISIPHSQSNPGIHRKISSPGGINSSPAHQRLAMPRYMTSQSSLATSSSEHSDNSWSDVVSEETLV